ncbi:MAG: hypothetical protein R3E21_01495 [Caenibius sp.]
MTNAKAPTKFKTFTDFREIIVIKMKVAATDAARLGSHQHIPVILDLWILKRFKPDIIFSVKD